VITREDAAYFERRAEAQIALAQRSTDSRAVQAHYELATHYLDRVYALGAEQLSSGSGG